MSEDDNQNFAPKPPRRRRRRKPGEPPGTLTPPENADHPIIEIIACDAERLHESKITTPEDIIPFLREWPLVWINVDGLASTHLIEKLGAIFALHPLAMEDILNIPQRPKTEDYPDHLFIVARMARILNSSLITEQVSIFLGKNYILTFQEHRDGDCLDPLRERLRQGKGRRLRLSQADYLGYAIIDTIVDGYFPVLEHFSDRLLALESEALSGPYEDLTAATHKIKRDLRELRQNVWPMREMINNFAGDTHFVRDDTRLYLRDCHDHVIQVLELIETCREQSLSLIDIYLSSISARMNEIMQVLTIISTIFIPLGFIASVYGMNFDTSKSHWNMPELEWVYGYPFALSLMVVVAGTLLFWFYRRGWIGKRRKKK